MADNSDSKPDAPGIIPSEIEFVDGKRIVKVKVRFVDKISLDQDDPLHSVTMGDWKCQIKGDAALSIIAVKCAEGKNLPPHIGVAARSTFTLSGPEIQGSEEYPYLLTCAEYYKKKVKESTTDNKDQKSSTENEEQKSSESVDSQNQDSSKPSQSQQSSNDGKPELKAVVNGQESKSSVDKQEQETKSSTSSSTETRVLMTMYVFTFCKDRAAVFEDMRSVHKTYKDAEEIQSEEVDLSITLSDLVKSLLAEMRKPFSMEWKKYTTGAKEAKESDNDVTNCALCAYRVFMAVASAEEKEKAMRGLCSVFSQIGFGDVAKHLAVM